ncbi:hypothetical protein Dimus_014714 [Dionaea muscipula]
MRCFELTRLRKTKWITLARNEEQAISKEDAMRKEFEELERRYHETTARSSDAWVVVERSLNFRLQKAKAKAAGAGKRASASNIVQNKCS